MSVLNDLMEKAPDNILRKFARKCALRHVEKIKPYCSERDYQVIVTWLETGDESIRQAAREATELAADSTAESAIESAAFWAAKSAAELSIESAYWSAYWAAKSAAELAIESAYWSAYWAAKSVAYRWIKSDADSAREAEIQWQEQTLSEMMESNDD